MPRTMACMLVLQTLLLIGTGIGRAAGQVRIHPSLAVQALLPAAALHVVFDWIAEVFDALEVVSAFAGSVLTLCSVTPKELPATWATPVEALNTSNARNFGVAEGSLVVVQVNLLSDLGIPVLQPQQLVAITLEQAAVNLGKVLRAANSDAAVVPAPALGPASDVVDITAAPATAPLASGVQLS